MCDPGIERLLGDIHESLSGDVASTDGHSSGGIADKAAVGDADIEADDVTELESAVTGDAMDDLIID